MSNTSQGAKGRVAFGKGAQDSSKALRKGNANYEMASPEAVILSELDAARSVASAQSKDPYAVDASHSAARRSPRAPCGPGVQRRPT
jgi:hypothetical protein